MNDCFIHILPIALISVAPKLTVAMVIGKATDIMIACLNLINEGVPHFVFTDEVVMLKHELAKKVKMTLHNLLSFLKSLKTSSKTVPDQLKSYFFEDSPELQFPAEEGMFRFNSS